MTLKELSKEYFESEKAVRERIKILSKDIHKYKGQALYDYKYRLQKLYSIAENTHEIACYLENYYNTKGDFR